MTIDARSVPDGAAISSDLCIVGAGAAGITLALSLADEGFRTVLLESGGIRLDGATQELNAGENTGLSYFPLIGTRLRYFGGTTNHWGGTCRPFDAFDFQGTPGIANTEWPITLDDVESYYEEAGRIAQLDAFDWNTDAWIERSGFTALPLDPLAIVTRVAQVVDPGRRSFNDAHREAVTASRVSTYIHANVTEIRLTEDHGSVDGLVVATPDRSFTVLAHTFVLAAGGIENARLLLASNRQQPAGVGNGEGLVGRYFLEHPRFVGGVIEPLGDQMSAALYQTHIVDNTRVIGYLALARDVQQAEGLVDVQLRMRPVFQRSHERARRSDDVDALRRLVDRVRRGRSRGDVLRDVGRSLDDLTSWRRLFVPGAPIPIPQPDLIEIVESASPDELDALLPEFFGDIAMFGYGEVMGSAQIDRIELSARIDPAPNPESRITLGAGRDSFGMPVPSLDWQLSRIDHDSVRQTLDVLGHELGRTGLGRLQVRLPADDTEWPEDLAGGYHHMGTTRMSADPRHGVVDADCRVHGLSNLYVAGSSVFTTGGSATPTLTLIALALRLADRLRAAFG